MSAPYTPPLIARLLRAMPDSQLIATMPVDFHRWPTTVITPTEIIADLIRNETNRRKGGRHAGG